MTNTGIAKKKIDKGLVLILSFPLLVFITGILTEFKFSDEIFHFWFARDWFDSGQRPLYNHLVDTLEDLGYFRYYVNAPLWHGGLTYLAKAWGGLSKDLAQAYQALHYFLLIITTYLLAKALYGTLAGRWAALIAATTPLFVSFGVIFFMDMPVAAWTSLLLFFMVTKRFVLAGVVFGIMFLTKENAYLLSPAIAALTFLNVQSDRLTFKVNGIKDFLKVFLVVLVITSPDFIFKCQHFGFSSIARYNLVFPREMASKETTTHTLDYSRQYPHCRPREMVSQETTTRTIPKVKEINYIPSDILEEPLDIPRYLGLVLLLLLLLLIVNLRKLFVIKDLILLLPIITYIPLFFIAFKGWLAIRYLSPIIPLAVVLVSKLFTPLPDHHAPSRISKWLRQVIFILCLLQFISTLVFVYMKRQVSPREREAINYIRSYIPPDSRILTPDELFFSYYTGRATIWRNSLRSVSQFYMLFWGNEKQVRTLLKKYDTDYMVIRKERIYDDSKVRYQMGGGFPRSFVERLSDGYFIKVYVKVYENDEVAIWSVTPEQH